MPQTLEGLQVWDLIQYLGQLNPDFTFTEIMALAERRQYDQAAVVELYPWARAGMMAGIRDLEKSDGT